MAAGNRSFAPQPSSSCLPFSRGDGPIGSPVALPRRLDGVPGSPGRVLPGSGAPVISALPEVLRGGFSASVPRSLLWPFDCPSGVYASHGAYLSHHALLRFRDHALPGRLARVLSMVWQSRGLELTLVAPFWPQYPWFPDPLELLVAVPVFLPQWKDLLRQPYFHRFHQNFPVLRLTAFRISSDPQESSASLYLPAADELPPG